MLTPAANYGDLGRDTSHGGAGGFDILLLSSDNRRYTIQQDSIVDCAAVKFIYAFNFTGVS